MPRVQDREGNVSWDWKAWLHSEGSRSSCHQAAHLDVSQDNSKFKHRDCEWTEISQLQVSMQ